MPEPYLLDKQLRADLRPLSRRRFLKAGLLLGGGALALAAGGFAVFRRSEQDRLPVPAGLKTLTAQEYLLFSRLARLILPTAGTTLADVASVPVVSHVDGLLAGLEPDIRKQLGMGLALFDNAAILTGGHWGRFVDLPDAEAAQYLHAWLNSTQLPLRAVAGAVTRLVKTGYWMDPTTWAAVEFDGPVSKKWGIASQGNTPLPV